MWKLYKYTVSAKWGHFYLAWVDEQGVIQYCRAFVPLGWVDNYKEDCQAQVGRRLKDYVPKFWRLHKSDMTQEQLKKGWYVR